MYFKRLLIAIETLSPVQSVTKITKSILHCLKSGTQMGWLIDPTEQKVFVYLPQQQTQVFDVPVFASELRLS